MTSEKIPRVSETEFYTNAKREDILEKEKRYLAEFTVEDNILFNNEDEKEEEVKPGNNVNEE